MHKILYYFIATFSLILAAHLLPAQEFTRLTFNTIGPIPPPNPAGEGSWVDFDNDGDYDMLIVGTDYDGDPASIIIINQSSQGSEAYEQKAGGLATTDGDRPGISWTDYDHDGDMDLLLSGRSGKIYRNDGNGNFTDTGITLEQVPNAEWGDIDNDGDPDVLSTWQVYLNEGSDQFTLRDMGLGGDGFDDSAWGDYDNDGDLDLIWLEGGGGHESQIFRNDGDTLIGIPFDFDVTVFGSSGYGARGNGWRNGRIDLGDYNNDGKVDMLIAGSGRNSSPGEPDEVATVVYRNIGPDPLEEGNWLFKQVEEGRSMREREIQGAANGSVAWGDYDNDGDLDFLVTGDTQRSSYAPVTRLYRNDGDDTFTLVDTGLENVRDGSATWGDYDNDGDLDILLVGRNENGTVIKSIYLNNSEVANTPPEAPANLRQQVYEDSVVFTWNAATDAETPSAGLNYNIWIGTSSETADVVAPDADLETGFRRVVRTGNAGWTNRYCIRNLPKEKSYYWSVQAIDGAFAGSAFAPVQNFENTTQPLIQAQNFPADLTFGATNNTISIQVADDANIEEVTFFYKGIAESGSEWKEKAAQPASNNLYEAAVTDDMFDEVGITYYFEITKIEGDPSSSEPGYTHIRYPAGTQFLENLKQGTQEVSSYQIVAVPLNLSNKNVTATFSGLGSYDITQWRLFHYQNGSTQEYPAFNTIEVGKGYWLIVGDNQDMDVGEGVTVNATPNDPFTLTLQPGWNQIGNPYDFDISWTDVQDENDNLEELGNLTFFESSFVERDRLPRFRGGFVHWDGTAPTTIVVPMTKDGSSGGRWATKTSSGKIPDEDAWEVAFSLETEKQQHTLSGFGMHPGASLSKDRHDRITPPRFLDYLELNFDHPEFFSPRFAKDVVPVAENHIWEFAVTAASAQAATRLSWKDANLENIDKELVLVDVKTGKNMDMKSVFQYEFDLSASRNFRIYYGDENFIQENLKPRLLSVGDAFPNPGKELIQIPLRLPDTHAYYHITGEIFNTTGSRVFDFTQSDVSPGYEVLAWNRKNTAGKFVPAGIYLLKIMIRHGNETQVFQQKLLIE